MPFTVSHVAVVLPARWLPARLVLPAAPLVTGAMVPDLPMFLGSSLRSTTHAWSSVPTLDAALAVGTALLWTLGLRDLVQRLAPGLAARWHPAPLGRASAGGTALRWYLAGLVGSASHLALDAFTHEGPFVERIPLLAHRVGPFEVAGWLQYGLSAVGLLVLAVWALRWWRTTEPRHEVLPPGVPALRTGPVLALAGGLLALGTVVGLAQGLDAARDAGPGSHHLWQLQLLSARGAFAGGGVVLAGVSAVAVCWRVGRATGRWPEPAPSARPLPEPAGRRR
ncbi:DUF4184 family protein [Angustibacter aerolatus]